MGRRSMEFKRLGDAELAHLKATMTYKFFV
jgi:hypothetical protein